MIIENDGEKKKKKERKANKEIERKKKMDNKVRNKNKNKNKNKKKRDKKDRKKIKIIKEIGDGANSQVFLVEYKGKKYAMKRFESIYESDTGVQEYMILCKLQKYEWFPKIIKMRIDEETGIMDILMPIYEKVEEKEVNQIETLKALDCLHKEGIIHGDLKIENMMMDKERNKIIMIDFTNSLFVQFPYRHQYIHYSRFFIYSHFYYFWKPFVFL